MGAKQLAQEVYACFDRGDLKGVLNTMAEDVAWEMLGPPSIPYSGRYSGKKGVESFFANLFEHEDILEFVPEQFVEEGDTVAVIGRERCRSKQTGRSYEARWVQVFKAANNKIVSWCEYLDTTQAVAAYRMPATGPF